MARAKWQVLGLILTSGTTLLVGYAQGVATIGGPGNEWARSVVLTRDGGYAIAGYTTSFGQGAVDAYLIKLDSLGNIQWTRTIGGSANNDAVSCVIQTTDGGYALAGWTYSYGSGQGDAYLVKMDASGNIQWTRVIGGTNEERIWKIIQTTDGGYVAVGYTISYGPGYRDAYVIKLDSSGNVQWTRTIGGTSFDEAASIVQTTDGGYAIVGYSRSYTLRSDVLVVKLDASGFVQWAKFIGGDSVDVGADIIQTSDGGYVVAGWTYSYGQGGEDVFVVKLDGSGNVQWTRAIGGSRDERAYAVIETHDGGYVVAGMTESFGHGAPFSPDGYVLKLDASGNLEWVRSIGRGSDDVFYSVVETRDHGFLLAGYTNHAVNLIEVWLVKIDSLGNLTVSGCPDLVTQDGVMVPGGTAAYDSVLGIVVDSGRVVIDSGQVSSGGTIDTCGSIASGGGTGSDSTGGGGYTGEVFQALSSDALHVWRGPQGWQVVFAKPQKNVVVEVYDMVGRVVYRRALVGVVRRLPIAVSLPSGTYALRVSTAQGVWHRVVFTMD